MSALMNQIQGVVTMQKVAKKIDMDSYQKKKRRRRILRDWALVIGFAIFIILAFVFVYMTSDESNVNVEEEFGNSHSTCTVFV